MKLTYRSLPHDDEVQGDDPDVTESEMDLGGETHNRTQWDDDCPWSEWYSAEDPVKGSFILNCFIVMLPLIGFVHSRARSFRYDSGIMS